MAYDISKVEVWAADVPNRPGTLASTLKGLSDAGAQLDFMIARKLDDNTSRVFVAPVKGVKQKQAARAAGLTQATSIHTIRVEGPDKAGLGAKMTEAIAMAGINLRGASAAAVGKKALFYFAMESEEAMKQAVKAARAALK
jgi:hypothetical protein